MPKGELKKFEIAWQSGKNPDSSGVLINLFIEWPARYDLLGKDYYHVAAIKAYSVMEVLEIVRESYSPVINIDVLYCEEKPTTWEPKGFGNYLPAEGWQRHSLWSNF